MSLALTLRSGCAWRTIPGRPPSSTTSERLARSAPFGEETLELGTFLLCDGVACCCCCEPRRFFGANAVVRGRRSDVRLHPGASSRVAKSRTANSPTCNDAGEEEDIPPSPPRIVASPNPADAGPTCPSSMSTLPSPSDLLTACIAIHSAIGGMKFGASGDFTSCVKKASCSSTGCFSTFHRWRSVDGRGREKEEE